jgi:hypothetical protein
MPSARAMRIMAAVLLGLAAAACAEVSPSEFEYRRIPLAVRTGAADLVVEHVDPGVSRDELTSAVRRVVENARVCVRWPAVWIEQDDRHSYFVVRYGLMARDWGADIAARSVQRMQEFVEMGFLEQRDRPDLGDGAVQYSITAAGSANMIGLLGNGERPSFCAPGGRRLVDIINVEWGDFPCGNVRIYFSHVADEWPTWVHTDEQRDLIAQTWAPAGVTAYGRLSLYRLWYPPRQVPANMTRNGELRSACYDAEHERITGDDIDLRAPAPPTP